MLELRGGEGRREGKKRRGKKEEEKEGKKTDEVGKA